MSRLLRHPLTFVWRYALGWRSPALVEEPLSLDARAWGELVHELLRKAVDKLEPDPGYTRANETSLRDALSAAAHQIGDQWPLERSIPPLLLWQYTLARAEAVAFRALTLDAGFSPGTRSWTEVPFGGVEVPVASWPWDTTAPVTVPGTAVLMRGSIDRLDLNAPATSVRVTDYKTSAEPPRAEQIVVSGGASLQRVIYAIAAKQLLPDARRVIARLFYLEEELPRARELLDVDKAIEQVSGYVQQAWVLLQEGTTLPSLVPEQYEDYRLAMPADAEKYRRTKRASFRRAFGAFARVWEAP
ncbi:MAG: PD-(D/E)XK nuclease family protein [Burkholderiales bacterium]|nr:PD-(D/E)XK nuclease family protein [Burkholderiales bacterium]